MSFSGVIITGERFELWFTPHVYRKEQNYAQIEIRPVLRDFTYSESLEIKKALRINEEDYRCAPYESNSWDKITAYVEITNDIKKLAFMYDKVNYRTPVILDRNHQVSCSIDARYLVRGHEQMDKGITVDGGYKFYRDKETGKLMCKLPFKEGEVKCVEPYVIG